MSSVKDAIRELTAAGFNVKPKPPTAVATAATGAISTLVAEPMAHLVTPRTFDESFADEYLKLAEELGVSATPLQREREAASLERTIAAMGLRVYQRAQVNDYLTAQYGEPKPHEEAGVRTTLGTWAWRPLRERDKYVNAELPPPQAPRAQPRADVIFIESGFTWMGGRGGISKNGALATSVEPYRKAIPMPVLLTVKEIIAKHPSARFFVSDELSENEARPIRDPFLLVKLSDTELIIERWDEPSYRER